MNVIRHQEAYVSHYWTTLQHDTTQVTYLPGKKDRNGRRPPKSSNELLLDDGPLPVFEKTPNAAAFITAFGRAPHAIVRIGRTGLLAVVEIGEAHTVVPLTEDGFRQPFAATAEGRPLTIGRDWLSRTLNFTNPGDISISNTHMRLEVSEETLMLRDLYSTNGTLVATQYPDESDFADDLDWQSELDRLLSVPV